MNEMQILGAIGTGCLIISIWLPIRSMLMAVLKLSIGVMGFMFLGIAFWQWINA